ncbi:TIGR04149 family rSAM-modified RiPP [Bacteroides caecimuris]|uniref:TIGR04149 family rSAM-modified RiPP n=3 Tax=Bacteroides caecimuris TaxID=1796613 RepID=UPI00242F3F3E|nr:TIGR04149 family rSAM-modified RiPP [Bacteroides caecimuris]
MKKITKTNFQGLRQLFSVLGKEEMRHYVGGTSGGYYYTGGWNGNGGYYGSPGSGGSSYYSQYDFDNWEGPWYGGWVEGMGWVAPDTYIYGYKPEGGSSNPHEYPYWWYYDEPLEHPNWDGNYGGYYPGYTGNGYYYGYGNYGEGYFTGGGGSGSTSGDSSSNALTDGVDIGNIRNFTLNLDSQPVFNKQIVNILRSNSVLKALLSYFDKGYLHLTFSIEEGMDKHTTAYTTWKSDDSYHIVFNSQYITDQGWDIPLNRIDNIGYDWSKVNSANEALVVTLTHEAIHANHFAIFNDAQIQAEGKVYETYRILQEKGYSQEFIDIFIDENIGEWTNNEQRDISMHEYMNKYDHGVIDSALKEYRNDFKE